MTYRFDQTALDIWHRHQQRVKAAAETAQRDLGPRQIAWCRANIPNFSTPIKKVTA